MQYLYKLVIPSPTEGRGEGSVFCGGPQIPRSARDDKLFIFLELEPPNNVV
jgi:hypothetical protein